MTDLPLTATVVVAVRSDQRRTRRLVASLLAQTMPEDSYEVIVVENGSAELADLAGTDYRVNYVGRAEPNVPAARNAGLSAARGRFLLLTDSDCVASPDWVEKMVAHLSDGQFVAAGGPIRKYRPRTWVQRHAITVVDGQRELSYLPALGLPYFASANACYVTAALREIGGFDEAFHSGSDVDICYRLALCGFRIGLVPDAVIFHDDRTSVGEHFRRFRHYAIYQVLLHAKYKHLSHRRVVLNPYPFQRLVSAIRSTPRAVTDALRGDLSSASSATLQVVEAVAVWWGDICGSARYKQLYL